MKNYYRYVLQRISLNALLTIIMAISCASYAIAATETATRQYDLTQLSYFTTSAPDSTQYICINWNGLDKSTKIGAPELPVEYINFIVPVYSKVKGIKVSYYNNFKKSTDIPVYPVQRQYSGNFDDTETFTYPDDNEYNHISPIRAEYISDGFLDGCNHLATIAVYPVAYNPHDGSIMAAATVNVSLEYESCQANEMSSSPIFPPFRSPYIDLKSMVVNPTKVLDRNFAPRCNDLIPCEEHYYIITPEYLRSSFEDLAIWKHQKGYTVHVESIEEILADYRYKIGSYYMPNDTTKGKQKILDSETSLRLYLRDQYKQNGYLFCLLAGDWRTKMPIRKAVSSNFNIMANSIKVAFDTAYFANNYKEAIPTDVYFVNPTVDYTLYKRDPMSIYSIDTDSVNFCFSISIGRLLCATPQEVQNYTKKLILYESNPGYGDNDYLSSAVFFEGCDKEQSKTSGWYHMGCNYGESKKVRDLCDFFDDITLYQDQYHLQSGADPSVIDPSAVTPEVEDGPSAIELIRKISQTGFSSWHAHGTPYGVACSTNGYVIHSSDSLIGQIPYQWEERFKRIPHSGLNNLSNNEKPAIVFSCSCENAPFDALTWNFHYEDFSFTDVNLGRAFTTEGKNGGPAAIMATREIGIYSSAQIEKEFISALKHCPKIGTALRNAALKTNVLKKDKMKLNLIGEPEFEMWLGKPSEFHAQTTPYSSGISITGNFPDSTYYSISNGVGSSAKLPLTSNTIQNPYAGEFCLSIWKSKYLPFITLFAQRGQLSTRKRYIVRNAIMGNTTDSAEGYSILKDGVLSVTAIDNISVSSGFTIDDGGKAELNCDRSVILNGGVVKKGGSLIINAKSVQLGSGFKVEAGGFLKINNH